MSTWAGCALPHSVKRDKSNRHQTRATSAHAMHELRALSAEHRLVMRDARPAHPINRRPRCRVPIAAGQPFKPDCHQTRPTHSHARHPLLTRLVKDHLIVGDTRPAQPIDRRPHHRRPSARIPLTVNPLLSDRNQARPSSNHTQHLPATVSSEDSLIVGNTRPAEPINRRPHRHIKSAFRSVRSDCDQSRPTHSHTLYPRSAKPRLVVGNSRPGEPINRRPHRRTRPISTDCHQTRAAHHHAAHRRRTKGSLVQGDTRPRETIKRRPDRRVP